MTFRISSGSARMMAAAVLATAAVGLLSGAAQGAPVYEFGTAGDFTSNFFIANTGVAHVATDDGGVGAGGFLRVGTTNDPASFIYDTTPDATATNRFQGPFTVDVDVRFEKANGDPFFGIYVGAVAARDGVLTLITNKADNIDTVRFFSGGSISTLVAGTQTSTFDKGDIFGLYWTHLQLTVEQVNSDTQLALTLKGWSNSQTMTGAPTFSHSYTYSVVDSTGHIGLGEVGFRAAPGTYGADVDIDNISITIPEPASLTLSGGFVAGGLLLRRRRA